MESSLLAHWYFHAPNFLLAALGYSLLGRMLLGLVLPSDSQNYILRFFRRLTDPAVELVAAATPRIVDRPFLVALAFVWTILLRVVLLVALLAVGMAPSGESGS